MRRTRPSENGSAFFIILIAIMMFAMLSYAVSKGGRSGVESMTKEQTRVIAQEIISYGDAVQKAVATLRLRGCTDTQLNFTTDKSHRKNGPVYDYTNASSPTDESCHVFSLDGGKVMARTFANGLADPAVVPNGWMDSGSFIVTATRMDGAGTNTGAAGTDLILWVGRLRPEVCMAINDILGVTNPGTPPEPPVDTFDCADDPFQGTYTSCANPIGNIPQLTGRSAYCNAYDDSGPYYTYYQLLVAR